MRQVYLISMIPMLLNAIRIIVKCNTGTWWTSSVHITLIQDRNNVHPRVCKQVWTDLRVPEG